MTLHALLDLMMTASSIGLVCSVGAMGILVLPWRASELDETHQALATGARMTLDLARGGWIRPAAPQVARG